MTVPASQANRYTYAGNGVTTAFAYSSKFLANADLVVVSVNDTTGVETTKALTTDYTVTGAGTSAGTVTMLTAPASGTTLVIYGDPGISQLVDPVNGDDLDVDVVIEAPLDKLTIIARRLKDIVTRSLRQPEGDTADIDLLPAKVTRASKFLAFDADGDPVASSGTPSGTVVVVSTFMETVLDDTTAAAARTTLGLDAIRFGNGAYTPGVSGTDLGVDTINAKGFYNNGSSNRILPIIIATASTPAAQTTVDKSVSSTINGLAVQYNRVVVMGRSISTNGTSPLIVQLSGISGTPETSGYVSAATELRSAAGTLSGGTSTAGFLIIPAPAAASSYSFTLLLSRVTGNTWSGKLSGNDETNGYTYTGHGTIALPNAILTVRLTTAGGADLFDVAGSFNITYE